MLGYEIDGQGPPLLLIHGFGISFPIWQALRPNLRDHFTLIAVELPGIGRSPAPATGQGYLDAAVEGIEELRAALGIEQWRMLSYSTGTRLAERYLRCHGDRVERAVFLCPLRTRAITASALRAAIHLDHWFPSLGNWVLSGWRLRFLIDLLGFNLTPNVLAPAWHDEITSQPLEILKETLRTLPGGGEARFNVPEGQPVLFVWGREDLITASPRRSYADHLVIHANHSAPQTSTEALAKAILPFLN